MDPAAAFELPPGARTGFKLKSAWTEDAHKPVIPVAPGGGAKIKLQPFESPYWRRCRQSERPMAMLRVSAQ